MSDADGPHEPPPFPASSFDEEGTYEIPHDSIMRWIGFNEGQLLALLLKRQDVDRFYFSHIQLIRALWQLDTTLVAMSHADVDTAAKHIHSFRQQLNSADVNLRKFMTAVMDNSMPYEMPVAPIEPDLTAPTDEQTQ